MITTKNQFIKALCILLAVCSFAAMFFAPVLANAEQAADAYESIVSDLSFKYNVHTINGIVLYRYDNLTKKWEGEPFGEFWSSDDEIWGEAFDGCTLSVGGLWNMLRKHSTVNVDMLFATTRPLGNGGDYINVKSIVRMLLYFDGLPFSDKDLTNTYVFCSTDDKHPYGGSQTSEKYEISVLTRGSLASNWQQFLTSKYYPSTNRSADVVNGEFDLATAGAVSCYRYTSQKDDCISTFLINFFVDTNAYVEDDFAQAYPPDNLNVSFVNAAAYDVVSALNFNNGYAYGYKNGQTDTVSAMYDDVENADFRLAYNAGFEAATNETDSGYAVGYENGYKNGYDYGVSNSGLYGVSNGNSSSTASKGATLNTGAIFGIVGGVVLLIIIVALFIPKKRR